MRLPVLSLGCAMAIVACVRTAPGEAPGFVAAPMLPPSVDAGENVSAPMPGDASSKLAARPLPPEPKAPQGMFDCQRTPVCRSEDEDLPAWPLPPPFERCRLSLGKPAAAFSADETVAARMMDLRSCCYVEFSNCSTHQRYRGGFP